MTDRIGGSLVALFTIFWIGALAFLVSGLRDEPTGGGTSADPPAEPSPVQVALPAEIEFGEGLDPQTNELLEPRQNFPPGSALAFAARLDNAVGLEEVAFDVSYLHWNGGYDIRVEGESLAIEPEADVITGTFSTDELIDRLGRGSFQLRIFGETKELLALGVFQLDVVAPEALAVFIEPQPVAIAAGEHVGYHFDGEGVAINEHAASEDADTIASAIWRASFDGQPYLLITNGAWSGFWLPESDSVRLPAEDS